MGIFSNPRKIGGIVFFARCSIEASLMIVLTKYIGQTAELSVYVPTASVIRYLFQYTAV